MNTEDTFLENDFLACGGYHTLFLPGDGNVYSCGRNTDGQLGVGDRVKRNSPTLIKFFKEKKITIKKFDAGYRFSIFIDSQNQVYTVGFNGSGKLGHNNVGINSIHTPQLVKFFSLNNCKICSVKGGYGHIIYLSEKHRVYTSGYNKFGELGVGDTLLRSVPTLVYSLRKERIERILGKGNFTFFLTSTKLFACGRNDAGQFGIGKGKNLLRPVWLKLQVRPIRSLAPGYHHNIIAYQNSKVYGFGINFSGQLAVGDKEDRVKPKRIIALKNEDIVSVTAGAFNSFFITSNGEYLAAGFNKYGQLGFPRIKNESGIEVDSCVFPERMTPSKFVALLPNERIIKISVGEYHTTFLTNKGNYYASGKGDNGELGIGKFLPANTGVFKLTLIKNLKVNDIKRLAFKEILTLSQSIFKKKKFGIFINITIHTQH